MNAQDLLVKACYSFDEMDCFLNRDLTPFSAGYQKCYQDLSESIRKEIHAEYFNNVMFWRASYEILHEEKLAREYKEALHV
jgi:hypothetical protein